MPDSITATQPGQPAAPTSAGTETPASGTSGQATTPTEPTSPAAAAPTSAPAQDVLVAKVYGSEIPVDLRDRTRLQEIVQKGLAFDRHQEKLEEQINARADQLLQQRAQKQAEDQRLANIREADPLAYDVEMLKKAEAERALELKQEVTQLRDTLHNLTWTQQTAEAKRQYPDLNQNDWNYAYAQVVANQGRVPLMEAARIVKEEKDRFEKQVIDGYLQKLKTNAQNAAPAVPASAGGTPSPHTAAPDGISFRNKDGMKQALSAYIKGFQGS